LDARGEPIILDFGLAKFTDPDADAEQLTKAGSLVGTPSYMSPEQVVGDSAKIHAGSDIYNLGVILYALLTGEVPFRGPHLAMLAKILKAAPQPPRERRPEIDERLNAVCLRALAKKPEERYTSMADFASALVGETSATSSSGPLPVWLSARMSPQPSPSAKGRKRWVWLLVAALVLAGAGAAIWLRN